jgi:hypothetical protein
MPLDEQGKRFRIGVAVPSIVVSAWVVHLIETLRADPSVEETVVLVVSPTSPTGDDSPSRGRPWGGVWGFLDALVSGEDTDSDAPADVLLGTPGVTTLGASTLALERRGAALVTAAPRISGVVQDHVELASLNSLVWLLHEPCPHVAVKYGTWELSHSSSPTLGPGPLGSRRRSRSFTGAPNVVVELIVTRDGSRAVAERRTVPVRRATSLAARNAVAFQCLELVRRQLARLVQGIPAGCETESTGVGIGVDAGTSPLRAGAASLARSAYLVARSRRDAARSRRDRWVVGFRDLSATGRPLAGPAPFTWLVPPPQRSFADPFAVRWQGRSLLFFEDYADSDGKASISFVELDRSGPSVPETALTRDYHLSYPYIFQHCGELFMLPEARRSGLLTLYRMDGSPARWVPRCTILESDVLVDPTIIEVDERLWMFCASSPPDAVAPSTELHLFSAANLEGPWVAHPCNPIVCDVGRARPAGTPFFYNGALIRPGQDCSDAYGKSIVFSRVDVLDAESYCETPIGRLEVSIGAAGTFVRTHTYSRGAGLELVDARQHDRGNGNPRGSLRWEPVEGVLPPWSDLGGGTSVGSSRPSMNPAPS